MLRKLFQTTRPDAQPFVISGSGTLGWDMVAANLAERGDEVLVLHTGYFADSFADCFETYGVKATQLKARIGDRPQLDEVEKALKEKRYRIVTVTHVDTSTGVLSEIQALSEMVHKVSPETLVVVDGVCSVGSEEIRFDDWALDVVLTASQKAIGCPAGLSIMMCSGRAIEVFKNRKTPPSSYFASFKNWLPSKLDPLAPHPSTSSPSPPSPKTQTNTREPNSNAKLRGQKTILLRHPLPPTHPRPAHIPHPNHLFPPDRPLRRPPRRLAESQIPNRRPRPRPTRH